MSVRDCAFGRGLFADRRYEPGETILYFEGRRVTADEAAVLDADECYLIQLGRNSYLDPDPPGRFVNHGCDPNAAIRDDFVLVALRAIELDEEILFDYSTTMSEGDWTMECRCGSPACRGRILDFGELPEALQERYLALGVVQRFISAQIASAAVGPLRPRSRGATRRTQSRRRSTTRRARRTSDPTGFPSRGDGCEPREHRSDGPSARSRPGAKSAFPGRRST
jgi:hypothetical protein